MRSEASAAAADTTATDLARARRHGVGDLLHRTARRYPGKLAVVDGDRRFTYAEFDAAVNRAAHALDERGIAKGDRLALLSHNRWEFAVLTFATARLGVVLVPINFMLTSREVAYILTDSRASGLVAEDALVPTAAEAITRAGLSIAVLGQIGGEPAAGWSDVGRWCLSESAAPIDIPIADDDPIRLMYTSGTESSPKGVIHTSRSLISQYVSCAVDGEMSADDVEVHALPMYHCAQLDCFFAVDVYLGATSVILPQPNPRVLLATIESHRITKLFAPPTVWISLLRCPEFDTTDLSSLRKGYYGASPMPVEVLHEMRRRLPGVRLWNFYGQTELAPMATILRPDEQVDHAGSAGRPAINVETAVVDDDGEPVPAGVVGEIVHRSPHVTAGYYNDADKTAEAFRGGWFHSGDLGVLSPDGYLSVVDRKKDMIKTGGENVASREVEEALYGVDGVAEVAVFGIPHPHWIEAVTAVIVARDDRAVTVDAVLDHAKAVLAPYKRPKYVVFVDALPKNPSGKIVKRELRAQFGGLAQ
ncbi:long-chain-fatty-acid--CoA ligase [Nocardia brasiliensis]|uniref:Long-chain-fatty-acid--CoA ligase n=1 Tax=Nocardia brasiliensis TaxID=37326 RepID=A0A6G9XTP2_NOCBR|nr:acyl-CoA synthetase [Nocardia brasiliensis]QIS04266.1 long-chain-fatty-acid--CoA ligase [Nocardia brasiliensis]